MNIMKKERRKKTMMSKKIRLKKGEVFKEIRRVRRQVLYI